MEVRLGRSPRGALDLTRAAVGLTGVAWGVAASGGTPVPLGTFFYSLLLIWSLTLAFMPVISWRLDTRVAGFVMTTDFCVIAAMIMYQSLVLLTLPYAALLMFTLHSAYLPRLQTVAIVGLSGLIAFFGMQAVNIDLKALPDTLLIERSVFVFLAMLTLLTAKLSQRYNGRLRFWSDGLLTAGTHSQRIPLEFVLEEVARRYPDAPLLWIEDEEAENPVIIRWTEDGPITVSLPANAWKKARSWLLEERAFMFDADKRQQLHRAEIEWPAVSEIGDDQVRLVELLSIGRRGLSFPIRVAEESARIFVGSSSRPSLPGIREGIEIGRAVEAVFERFHFQSAWRERAFVEARVALGRDLHDTVLQTMASLRLQIATLLSTPAVKLPSETRDALLQLQTTVAEEQRTFREILDEGHRVGDEAVELNAILANRLIALSEQWEINCTFVPAPETLMVDGNTAVEVEFIIREVVSNSVQHGRAKGLTVRISLANEMLLLSIMNSDQRLGKLPENGTSDEIKSKSLARRLTSLRASAYADDIMTGSLLSIRIPLSRR